MGRILNKTDGSNLLLGGNHYSDEVASKIKNELNEFGVKESRVLILKRTEKHEELLDIITELILLWTHFLQWSHNELRSNVDGSSSNNKKRGLLSV